MYMCAGIDMYLGQLVILTGIKEMNWTAVCQLWLHAR